MARRFLALLSIALAVTAVITVVAAVTVIRAVSNPRVSVNGPPVRSAKDGRAAATPAEALAQKEIETQYKVLQAAIDHSDANQLDQLITPDFRLERLFGDRVYAYNRQSWKAYLLRVGPGRRWPIWMSNAGVRLQHQAETRVEVGPVTLKGDTATVTATVTDTYTYSRIPAEAAYTARYEVTERDVWQKRGPSWRLQRMQMLKSRSTRESTLSE
jgi:hypothetical protein